MDENEVVRLYVEGKESLRSIAGIFSTDHHRIKRILNKRGIVISGDRKKRVLTEQHKLKISKSSKGRVSNNKGKKQPIDGIYMNMRSHLSYDVELEFLKFYDLEKLKALNYMIRKRRISLDWSSDDYKKYIEKFYYDEQFNVVYNIWIYNNKDSLSAPSLDHIIPLSRGGDNRLDNLQVMTWFENRCKNDMTDLEWKEFKKKTNMKSDYIFSV